MQKGKFNIIIGGQAGSESKGKLSGWLCDKNRPGLLVMTSSPNAGHTLITPSGEKKVSYHLPVGSVMCDCPILLGPASLINIDILRVEISSLGIDPRRIILDPRASVITEEHIDHEILGGMSNIGSTLQGIGRCRTSKMNRKGNHVFAAGCIDSDFRKMNVLVEETVPILHDSLYMGKTVLCESTQGFDLDLEHGIHPVYCTSKMINTSMIAAESGIPPSKVGDVYGVIRPYPIRVNNRTGTSGPYYGSIEITWDDIADRCGGPDISELTTTTKLPRRVFEFSWIRFHHFCRVCAPTHLCLQFANYLNWGDYCKREFDSLSEDTRGFISELEDYCHVSHIGTGPGHYDMIER